jgi:hypothetical protein
VWVLGVSLCSIVALQVPAESFDYAGKMLRTTPASGGKAVVYMQMMQALDQDLIAANGRQLPDRQQRLQQIRALTDQIKADARALASRIVANGEEKEFDAMVLARSQAVSASLTAQIQGAGGAVAILSSADRYVDAEIQRMQRELRVEGNPVGLRRLFALLNVNEAHAGLKTWIRTTACTGFWFVISVGYGTEHAYASCYN